MTYTTKTKSGRQEENIGIKVFNLIITFWRLTPHTLSVWINFSSEILAVYHSRIQTFALYKWSASGGSRMAIFFSKDSTSLCIT